MAELERLLVAQREEMEGRLAAQQAAIASQNAEIARLRAERTEAPATPPIPPARRRGRRATNAGDARPEGATVRPSSRRRLLKLGGVAAVAGVVAGAGELLRPGMAHAAAALPLDNPLSGTSSVNLVPAVDGTGTNGAQGVYGSSDTSPGVWGYASNGGDGVYGQVNAGGYGVHGYSPHGDGVYGRSDTGDGVVGVGHVGVVGQASLGGIDLIAAGSGRFLQNVTYSHAGPPTAADGFFFFAGELIRDGNHDRWICVADGNPGTWRQVAALAPGYAGGALNLLPVPIRLLDTRAGAPVGFALPGAPIGYHATLQMQAANLTFQMQTIPAGAAAVFGNLVVALAPHVNPGDGSSLICWPNGQVRPAAVNIVYNPGDQQGEYTSTFTLVAIGTSNFVNLYSQPITPGVAVDVIFDAFGFVM
jgi:hypothetical protein